MIMEIVHSSSVNRFFDICSSSVQFDLENASCAVVLNADPSKFQLSLDGLHDGVFVWYVFTAKGKVLLSDWIGWKPNSLDDMDKFC